MDKYFGKYSGEVTDNEDEDKVGKIKVKVLSVFGPDLEVIARPCLPFGHFFIPVVGTKVWVEFEGGNPNYPIWVGVWYPVDKPPSEAAINPPDNRVIQTPAGHTIEIMDKSKEEKISIRHSSNAFIVIDKDGSVMMGAKNGSVVILNAKDENIMIAEKNGNVITLKGDSIILVNKGGEATVEMKGGTVQFAATKIIIRGSQIVVGEGATEPTLMGTTFTTLFNTHTHGTAVGPSSPPVVPLVPMVGPHLTKATVVK